MSAIESRETSVHPTAVVHPSVELGQGTRVGPYATIEKGVRTGRNCEIGSHAFLMGNTTIGDEVQVYPFAALGTDPQHLRYKGEPTRVEIGDRSIFREYATVHRGTEFGGGVTRIGSDVLVMAYGHVAHDCRVGNKAIFANLAQIAGHVEVGESANIGGMTAVIQFCRVGAFSYIGAGSIVRKDLPPFLMGKGSDFEVQGVNAVGLERNGIGEGAVRRLRDAYKILYMQGLTVSRALEKIATELGEEGEVKTLLDFVRSSKVGIVR